jgi:hypothetical protein
LLIIEYPGQRADKIKNLVFIFFLDLFSYMKSQTYISTVNVKGAAIFKQMLEDKNHIRQHIEKGGSFSELSKKYKFAKPLSTP